MGMLKFGMSGFLVMMMMGFRSDWYGQRVWCAHRNRKLLEGM